MNTVGWIGLLVSHLAAVTLGVCLTMLFLDIKSAIRKNRTTDKMPDYWKFSQMRYPWPRAKPKERHEDMHTPAALARKWK